MNDEKRALFNQIREESEQESLIMAVHAKKVHYVPDEQLLVAQNKRLAVADWDDVVEKVLSLSIAVRFPDTSLQPVDPLPVPKTGAVVDCSVTVQVDHNEQTEYVDVPFHITVRRSIEEERISSGYFAGKVQLRGSHLDESERVAIELTKQYGGHITKRVEERGGVDLYLDDLKAIKQVALGLQQRLGGEIDMSPTVFSRDNQTQKDIIRLTTLYRAYPFLKGDLVSYDNQTWQLKKVGKFIELASLVKKKTHRTQTTEGITRLQFKPAVLISKQPLIIADAATYEQFENPLNIEEHITEHIEYVVGPDKQCYMRSSRKK